MHGADGVVRVARRVIRWLLPPEDRALLAELDDLHAERLARRGAARAALWYASEAGGFVMRLTRVRVREAVRATAWSAGVRDARRALRRRPGRALGVVATLAIGVGGVSSVYAVANWALLRPVPGVRDGDDVMILRLGSSEAPAHVSWRVSNPDYEALRADIPSALDLAASTSLDVHVDAGGEVRRIAAEVVSPNYFDVLGVRAGAGGPFGGAAAPDEVIVTPALAARAGEGGVLRVNGRRMRIAGVVPAAFRGPLLPGSTELWLELPALPSIDASVPADVEVRGGEGVWRRMYVRTAAGVSASRVALEANVAMERIGASGRSTVFRVRHFRMQAYAGLGADPNVRASLRGTLALLGAAAIFLLVLAVVNVTNLTAMEALSRRGGNAIRSALGARRGALAFAWLVEALVLGVAAAVAALAVAVSLGGLFRRMRLDDWGAPLDGLRIEGRVLAFTLMAGLLASLVAGLPAALSAGRARALAVLGRTRHGDVRGDRARGVFVVVQVAISLVLIAGAGLMGRTVANLRAVDLGFAVDDLYVFSIDPVLDGFAGDAALSLLGRVERALGERPEVRAAGFISPAPLRASWVTAAVYRDGGREDDDRVVAAQFGVTPGLLRVLGADPTTLTSNDGALVTTNLAQRAWPESDPHATPGSLLRRPFGADAVRVAGVIGDLHLDGVPGDPPPTLLRPFGAETLEFGVITGWVRASGSMAGAARAVREVIAEQGSGVPVFDGMSAREALDRLNAERVVLARVAALLGALGVLLAAVGLHGVLGRAVAERRHELGVRSALGATGRRLMRDIAVRGLLLGAAGCALGLPLAIAVSRVLTARLYGVGALDPATHGGAVALVLMLAVMASLAPALRVLRVSPLSALRGE